MALVSRPLGNVNAWNQDTMTSPNALWPAIDRLFGELASGTPTAARFPLDMYETDSHLALDIAVPGIRPENLDLQVEGRHLFIRGRYESVNDDGKRYWTRSLPSGNFEYTINLPVQIEADQVEATFEHGLLHLRFPKVAEARTRKIEIKRVS